MKICKICSCNEEWFAALQSNSKCNCKLRAVRTKRSGLVAAVFPGANISETLAKAKKDIEYDNWGEKKYVIKRRS